MIDVVFTKMLPALQ